MNDKSTLNLADPGLLKTQAYVDGQWCDANGGTYFDVTNPATGEVIATVPDMGADETRTICPFCGVGCGQIAYLDWALALVQPSLQLSRRLGKRVETQNEVTSKQGLLTVSFLGKTQGLLEGR